MESAPSVDHIQKISSSLNSIIKEIYETNNDIKRLEDFKSELRLRFFELADQYLSNSGSLQTQVVPEKCASRAQAEAYIDDNFPGWRIVQYDPNQIVIEEDPAKMKFEWTNSDGYQISRTTAVVGTTFDYEKLEREAPDVFSDIVEAKMVYELNEKKAQKLIEEKPEYLSVLQESTKLGKIQLRMSSPKKVKDE